MEIKELFQEFLTNLYMDDLVYNEMIYLLASDEESKDYLISYALALDIGDKSILGVLGVVSEVYGLYDEEYNIDFQSLYNCFLEQMFSSTFYEHSTCYKFSNLLVRISGNASKVYNDILNHVNPVDMISAQIAICSMYGQKMMVAFKDKEFINKFLEKILLTMQTNNDNSELIRDFEHFTVSTLKYYGYDKELRLFSKYIGN